MKFAGCGKNWGYVFVQADRASRHTLFHVTVAVTTDDGWSTYPSWQC